MSLTEPAALAARAHAAEDAEASPLLGRAAARSMVTAPAPLIEATLNENACGEPMCGCAEPAEQDPQHRVRIGRGADGGARVGAHPLLVDDDRRRQPVEHVDVRAAPASA